jgi:hypothetical protein
VGGGGTNDTNMVHVISIQREALNNSIFTDCTVETNLGGWGNGIAITDNGVASSTLHDVTFLRLHIMPQPRMGFEMIGREYLGPRTNDYYNIKIIDSIIEPSGSESVSFDGEGRDIYVQGSLFKGSGTSSYYSWHQALEFNGTTSANATGNTFYRSRGVWLNLHCTSCNFENNYFDNRVNNLGINPTSDPIAWMGGCNGCTFKNNQVIMELGRHFVYLDSASNNTFTGNTFWIKTNPTNQCALWMINSSTGNVLQRNKFYYKYQYYSDYSLCIERRDGSTISEIENEYYSPAITPIFNPPPLPVLSY